LVVDGTPLDVHLSWIVNLGKCIPVTNRCFHNGLKTECVQRCFKNMTIGINFLYDSYIGAYQVDGMIYNDDVVGVIKIGMFDGLFLSQYDPEKHEQAIEIANCITQDAYELCKGFNPSCLSGEFCCHLFVLNTMEIDKKYRRKKIGIKTMNEIINFFADIMNTVIIIKPHPIGTPLKSDGQVRLQKYWKKCGFKQCFDTPYFFRECDFVK
jgi:hypothetical protein